MTLFYRRRGASRVLAAALMSTMLLNASCAGGDEARASTPDGYAADATAAGTSTVLPDGRLDADQVRFDNFLMRRVDGWQKRGDEWGGQWTLEGPEFKTSRVQITAKWAVGLDEKGLAGMAERVNANSKQYIDFREEAKPVEGVHPAGYKMLTTFTSLSAPGYGDDCRLFMLNVYLEANGLGSNLHYAAGYRNNFDKYRPVFEKFVNDTRILSGQILADGFSDQPALDQFTVNQCLDFVEWLLDVPMTDEQRVAARDYFSAAWKRKDAEEAKGLWEVFDARNKLNELKKEQKELARVAAREEVIKQWREEVAKGDEMAKLMIDVYDRAHEPIAKGAEGEPPLTRQQADATLEILHFMASKVAGWDVGPSKKQKAEFAKKLAENYAQVPAEAKKELEQMPLYWAWLRVAWSDVSADEKSKFLEQWSKDEKIMPLVAKVQEVKAEAMKNDPTLALQQYYQQQQNVAFISNMMTMRHMANMSVINNIGSSNTRYEYKYVYRYR